MTATTDFAYYYPPTAMTMVWVTAARATAVSASATGSTTTTTTKTATTYSSGVVVDGAAAVRTPITSRTPLPPPLNDRHNNINNDRVLQYSPPPSNNNAGGSIFVESLIFFAIMMAFSVFVWAFFRFRYCNRDRSRNRTTCVYLVFTGLRNSHNSRTRFLPLLSLQLQSD